MLYLLDVGDNRGRAVTGIRSPVLPRWHFLFITYPVFAALFWWIGRRAAVALHFRGCRRQQRTLLFFEFTLLPGHTALPSLDAFATPIAQLRAFLAPPVEAATEHLHAANDDFCLACGLPLRSGRFRHFGLTYSWLGSSDACTLRTRHNRSCARRLAMVKRAGVWTRSTTLRRSRRAIEQLLAAPAFSCL